MSKYNHSIRVYRGDVVVGFVKVRDDLVELFEELTEEGARLEPVFNMVDEHYPQSDEPSKYEYNKLVHFDLVEQTND